MQRCHRAIVHASHTTPAVSWQRLVLHEEYHEATPEYKVQISRLDRVLTRLEAITAVGPSLTCTRTVHPDGTTELSLRRMFGDKDYFAAKSTDGPLLSVNPDLPTALHGMYHRPQLLNFSGKHGVIARLFVVLAFVGALVGGIMTFVDLVSDCLVVRELWLDDQRWWSVGSAIIILVSLLVSVFVLARERRYVHGSVVLTPGGFAAHAVRLSVSLRWRARCSYVAAFCQMFSLGGLHSVINLVRRPVEPVRLDLTNPSPLLGAHAVKQLQSLEALCESAPQMVLQLFIALTLGYSTTRALSLVSSLASLGLSLALGDAAAIVDHAGRDRGCAVKYPKVMLPIDGEVEAECRATGKRVVRVFGQSLLVSGDVLVLVLFRVVEVMGRLGTAALLCFVAQAWAVAGFAATLGSSFLWWFSGLPVFAVMLMESRGELWDHVAGSMPLPQGATLRRIIPAMLYTMIAFPGVGEAPKSKLHRQREAMQAQVDERPAGERARVPDSGTAASVSVSAREMQSHDHGGVKQETVRLTIEPWMQSLWTPHWSLSAIKFLLLRTCEHVVVLALLYVPPAVVAPGRSQVLALTLPRLTACGGAQRWLELGISVRGALERIPGSERPCGCVHPLFLAVRGCAWLAGRRRNGYTDRGSQWQVPPDGTRCASPALVLLSTTPR